MKNKPLVVIVGETASGKTGLAMELAREFNGEIISADSWAVYKHMDIGTAKPSEKEQSEIKHHLISIVEPDEDYTAGRYKQDALKAMNQIYTRDRLPIMAGGTGLYIDGVIFNFSFMKNVDKKTREAYNSLSLKQLIALCNKRGYDLTDIDTRNKRRVIRVLETQGEVPSRSKLRDNTLAIGLRINRSQLRKNIETRVDNMFKKGLKHEALSIADKYGWDCEGMQGIGYKEFKDWREGDASMRQVRYRILRNTLVLAKRQRTWFKRNRQIHWVDDYEQGVELVKTFLNR